MVKNKEPEKPVESDPESSEEEEEEEAQSDEDGSSDSESGSDETNQFELAKKPVPPKKPVTSKPETSSSSGESESEAEAEAEAEPEPEKPESVIKPTASKPANDKQKSGKKPRSKPETEPATPVKVVKEPEVATEKKTPFQRLFSDDDEIVILKGMIDYAAKNKVNPASNFDDFREFIKEGLSDEFTRSQLQEKLRRLKKKYEICRDRLLKKGQDKSYLKGHDFKAYELGEKIWGYNNGGGIENKNEVEGEGEKVIASLKVNGGTSKRKRQSSKAEEEVKAGKVKVDVENNGNVPLALQSGVSLNMEGKSGVSLNMEGTRVEDWVLRMGKRLFEAGNRVEGEREWKRLRLAEIELYMQKLDLMRAQTKLVLDVLESSDH